ncbi:MAG: 30S ribosomal protein S17 [candidate division Zixibacteria bacterium]|nr:30S ribosomal protein S17 [candidate division Zixibacteria bacterium]
MTAVRSKRKTRIGWVVSDKMDKTIIVKVERARKDSTYQKVMKKSTKLYAHDEKNQCKFGDKVKIMETRPLSKLKRWRLVEILEKGKIRAEDEIKEGVQ